MLKSLLKKDEGFTLIEVIIVLAIGALIILVVLQAIAAAQRAQRDNTRKQEAGRIVSLIEEYESNNNGNSPATWAAFGLASYDANLSAKGWTSVGTSAGAGCAESANTWHVDYAQNGARDFNLWVCLEAGGNAKLH